jgi:hypothetical protein
MKSDFSTFAYGKVTAYPKTTYSSIADLGVDDDMINIIENMSSFTIKDPPIKPIK